jgi:hypothetical protein
LFNSAGCMFFCIPAISLCLYRLRLPRLEHFPRSTSAPVITVASTFCPVPRSSTWHTGFLGQALSFEAQHVTFDSSFIKPFIKFLGPLFFSIDVRSFSFLHHPSTFQP